MATEESLPLGWEWKRLVDIADVARGKFTHRPRNDPKFYGGEIPFVQTSDVVNSPKYLRGHSQTLSQLGLTVSRMFPANTVLMVIAGSVGATAITKYAVAFPDSVVGITPKHGYSPEFIHHAIKSRISHLNDIATESAQANLSLELISMFKVATPAPDVANGIACFLDAIDEAIEATRAVIVQTRELKSTLLEHLLVNGDSQESFVEKRLGDVLREPIRNGYSATSPNYETGLWITTLSAVSSEGFNPLGVKPAPTGVEKVSQTLLQSGDIIVSRSNTRDLVGLAGLYEGIPFPCSYSDLLMRVRFDPDIISPEFALLCLLSDESRLYFRNTGRGTSGSMKKIDRSILENLPMRIPHLSVQAKVVEHIKSISERISIELKYLSQLIQLSSTLSHALLSGEIAQRDHCAKVEVPT